ncbi:efflux transporter outer membrane subunit [Azotobacter chroococcum]|uniref:efflux transporter outer membrane subunit n=1 Tax=Azotobacter chroococcum TaxID=353 RepID=UPI0010ADB87A|nr:efflux transporter outer membrane subunit [Azotobacter chroococcum]TKD33084.1 efflux transporter outer membrane subunit [Azotobacter chroococcum]
MNNRLPLLLGLAVALQGCSIEPFVLAPDPELPSSYRKASPDEPNNVDVRWWRVYRDPVLDYLVEGVLERNPYTQFGKLHVAEGQAGVLSTRADLFPNLNFGASRDESHTSTNTPLGELLQQGTIAGQSNRITTNTAWQIDLWGRIAQSVELAKAKLGVAEATRRSVALVLAREVAVAYWQFRAAEADYALLEQIRAERAEAVRLIGMRLDTGLNTEQDLLEAKVRLARVEAEMHEAVVKRDMNEQELAILMVVDVKDFRVPSPPEYALPEIPTVAPGLPAIILSRRPDLMDSSERLRALIAQERIAETAFYPSISLTSRYGFASQDLSDLTKHASREFSFVPISLNLPIFDAGRNRANLEAARLRYQQHVNVHKVNILIALRQVDDGLTQVQAARERLSILDEALEASQRRADVAAARYAVGQSNYLEVTRAQDNSLSLQRRQVRSRIDGLMASTMLMEALGGGWNESLEGGQTVAGAE